ncbi:DDE-type integrase/transposase/recombinase [Ruegeria sp. HKCCD7255]|uniref:DDE-type integrase/transposase/recombinase n=1 Tax=Ruegeria sp. HKCCD7255 TaxID=2683004 RepID=UPI0014878A24|nr:DDE-type integrase/transposase/recombinase [Ruegeria sp. HKCCD7255]
MVSFKAAHCPNDVALFAVSDAISKRCGKLARHTTLNHWVIHYPCGIADAVRRRNKPANAEFFARMLEVNGPQREIDSDKSDANTAGITAINKMLGSFGCPISIEMVRRKYPQSNVEQDHRFVKRRTQPMLGFNAFV